MALAIIGVVTFLLLFAVFGSMLVPLKAIVLNLLSLTAAFGAMVWIFQDGHLSGLLGFTPTGQLDVAIPILTFCIAFGLSMDYEVFLLSRIKEEHDRTGDNTAAVAAGLERSGRIVTAAAGVLAVTFLAVSTSGVTFIKMFGLGMALAVRDGRHRDPRPARARRSCGSPARRTGGRRRRCGGCTSGGGCGRSSATGTAARRPVSRPARSRPAVAPAVAPVAEVAECRRCRLSGRVAECVSAASLPEGVPHRGLRV